MLLRRCAAAALAIAACSGPARREAAPPPPVKPPPPPPPVYQLSARPEAPAFAMHCRGGKRNETAKVKTYEFTPRPMPTVEGGAEMREASVAWPARTPIAVHALLNQRRDALTACWKWASAKLSLADMTLQLTFDIDPLGAVSGLAITPHDPDALTKCIEEAVSDLHAAMPSARATHASIRVQFVTVDQPPWPKKPKRPKKAKPAKPDEACAPVIEGAPVDEVTVIGPLRVSDFDDSRRPKAKRSRGTSGPMMVRIGCVTAPGASSLDKRGVRRAVSMQNRELARCGREARERDPALAGELVTDFVVHLDGAITATASGAGDDALHGCVATALSAVWLGPQDQVIRVRFPFTLDALEPSRDPEVLLERGDGEAAMAIWGQRLLDEPEAKRACSWRAGMVRAAAVRAPWLYDPWVLDAIDALVREVAARSPENGRACLDEAWDILSAMIGTLDGVGNFEWTWRERLDVIERLLPVAERIPKGPDLRLLHARGVALADPAAAIAELRGIGTEEALDLARIVEDDDDVLDRACSPF